MTAFVLWSSYLNSGVSRSFATVCNSNQDESPSSLPRYRSFYPKPVRTLTKGNIVGLLASAKGTSYQLTAPSRTYSWCCQAVPSEQYAHLFLMHVVYVTFHLPVPKGHQSPPSCSDSGQNTYHDFLLCWPCNCSLFFYVKQLVKAIRHLMPWCRAEPFMRLMRECHRERHGQEICTVNAAGCESD